MPKPGLSRLPSRGENSGLVTGECVGRKPGEGGDLRPSSAQRTKWRADVAGGGGAADSCEGAALAAALDLARGSGPSPRATHRHRRLCTPGHPPDLSSTPDSAFEDSTAGPLSTTMQVGGPLRSVAWAATPSHSRVRAQHARRATTAFFDGIGIINLCPRRPQALRSVDDGIGGRRRRHALGSLGRRRIPGGQIPFERRV